MSQPDRLWRGQLVSEALDIAVRSQPSTLGLTVEQLAGLAVRDNPRRAHLIVSTALGKHIPTDPDVVYGAGRLLGVLVADLLSGEPRSGAARGAGLLAAALDGRPGAARELVQLCDAIRAGEPGAVVVLGYAETATALGHAVADSVGAPYLHSTRRRVAGMRTVIGFEEEHSHATAHALLPGSDEFFAGVETIVLVDDELSTGRTVLNTITALSRVVSPRRYVIASLLDLRPRAEQAALARFARDLGVRIEVVSLAQGQLDIAADAVERAAGLRSRQVCAARADHPSRAELVRVTAPWPRELPEGGRHGFDPAHRQFLEATTAATAAQVAAGLSSLDVLVLGTEELLYAPLRIATALAGLLGAQANVRFSSTTRSPVIAIAQPGYAIGDVIEFSCHDNPLDDATHRFAYNVAAGAYGDIVLVIDEDGDTAALTAPDGLLAQLSGLCDRLQLVVLPCYRPADRLPLPLRGPSFGSYAADDVAWLLTDLSRMALEAPTEEREEAVQSGAAHYAESLPIEYQPSQEYQQLFAAALRESAATVAAAVGVLTEIVLAERGRDAVLVSLARAGTPIGILMRRWARFAHGLDLAHYAISIVRGRGIDPVALRYLATRHHPAAVVFVDGWTGKGAITAELADAVARVEKELGLVFSPDLAVLADTGFSTSTFGTREDFLIPSACLNSTVSGLVSRTVLNDQYIKPGMFHGAKFYAGLSAADVSGEFISTVEANFPAVAEVVSARWPEVAGSDRRPTWSGWRSVEELSERYGIHDVNLVKPGVGETTRVLLRRIPWKVLFREDAVGTLPHVTLLAAQRGVEVEVVPDLAYRCVGLIHPGFTAGVAPVVSDNQP